jgi:hypothetical protein
MVFDTTPFTSDNNSRDAKNENDEVIRLNELTPLNDPNCPHHFVKDVDDLADTNDMQAWICRKCKRGTIMPKHINIINS